MSEASKVDAVKVEYAKTFVKLDVGFLAISSLVFVSFKYDNGLHSAKLLLSGGESLLLGRTDAHHLREFLNQRALDLT